MTIGIAVSGTRAGLGVFRALQAVEKVARGAIGGFVSLAAITTQGDIVRAQTQRGGTSTLFTDGELTGADPHQDIADAPIAVLMSSGPDRPEPLTQFTPGDAAVGLVSGHRLPNVAGVDGVPLNQAVLSRLANGETVVQAVDAELERNPNADAGIIAVDCNGDMAMGNTALVARRDDSGAAEFADAELGFRAAVLHNAIFPQHGIADLAIGAALDAVAPGDAYSLDVEIAAGLALTLGDENGLHLDADNCVEKIVVTHGEWLGKRHEGAVLLRGARVRRRGDIIGRVVSEAYCIAGGGRLLSISGRPRARLKIATHSGRR